MTDKISKKVFQPGPVKPLYWGLLAIIVVFSFSLRFYKVADVPAGFFVDEGSIGYHAYCLGKWGVDGNADRFPFYIKEVYGVQKNPVYVYSAIIPIKLFGLNERSVRLTSVLYGTLTVIGIFWLAFEIWGPLAGIVAALLLGITPWHFHFSRIAFELISLPCFFVFGFAWLLRSLRKSGWINWCGTAVVLGISLHTYVMNMVFLPFFLLLFLLLYTKELWRNKKYVITGFIIMSMLASPAVVQRLKTKKSKHFRSISWLTEKSDATVTENATRFWGYYRKFYEPKFLIHLGDRNDRHSVRDHGEIYRSFAWAVLPALLLLLIPLRRTHLLIFWWFALFPAGTALTTQTFASRSILGSLLAPLIIAGGFALIVRYLMKIKWQWLKYSLSAITSLILFVPVSQDAYRYFTIYFNEYNDMSASGIYGFQFGYRDVINYMEAHREEYPQRFLTATSVNNPQYLVNFYTGYDPFVLKETHFNGYGIVRPFAFRLYNLDKPTLFSLRKEELAYFDDYEIKKMIIDSKGDTQFIIADVRTRKHFLLNWMMMGLFDFEGGKTMSNPYPYPWRNRDEVREGLTGEVQWESLTSKHIKMDFQILFEGKDPRYNVKNPEDAWLEAATYVYFDTETEGIIHYFGSKDFLKVWVNGKLVQDSKLVKATSSEILVFFQSGWNEICFRSGESAGGWSLAMTLSDAEGAGFKDLINQAEPPEDFSTLLPDNAITPTPSSPDND